MTYGVSKVVLKELKFYITFRIAFSFMLISAKQWAVFLISRMFKEVESLSHNLQIRLSEYFYFSIKGSTFSKNIINVFSPPKVDDSKSENFSKASGIMLKRIFGSFLLISWKNCFTKASISGYSSLKSTAISHRSLLTLIMSFRLRWVTTVKVVLRTLGSLSWRLW